MSASREDDTFGEQQGGEEMDEVDDMDDEGSNSDEDEMEVKQESKGDDKVYVPGVQPLKPGEELEMDQSAYRMYHECQTGEWH